ncbi:MAG TPA: MFS transporter [Steroidobacteraceae bacterium]|jgi:SHS family lactate transporter-like MFS transporter|nr:MFS transporter [Steroidobacteraceae bacterium]
MASNETWTAQHSTVVVASFLGWMLDAFDFFLVVFVLQRLASDFGTDVTGVAWGIAVTLATRPIGAFLFGRIADRYGRRPALMASVLLYSAMELATAFSSSLAAFIVLRALYGIAMGGEWGVGASLAFESVPIRTRGLVSGILQAGYPCGYLLAAVVFGLLYVHIGWRGMFVVGAAPALLALYIFKKVPESTSWTAPRTGTARPSLFAALRGYWPLALYAIALMTCFNFFSHGTQDLYPTFLGAQRGFTTGTRAWIAVVYNIGAICGGLSFGSLSSRMGRRRSIALAAALSLIALPFWAYSSTPVALAGAAFAMQFMVQGAWGVVPVHLNELSPEGIRATFPGVVYQLGNLLAAGNSPLQSAIASAHGSAAHPDYSFALTLVCGVVAVALVLLALLGPERRDVRFAA